jgi:hypothetical protein
MSEALLRRVGAFVSSKRKWLGMNLLGLAFASAFLPVVASAQEFRATVTGTVADASGAKIPGANIEIKNLSTGVSVSTLTTGEGTYTTPFLAPGRYSVTATVSGFKTETKTNVELNVSDRQQIDFTLQIGGVSEQVTVEASGQQIESANADLGQSIGATATAELPLLGRNPFQLTTLASGVQHNVSTASRSDRPFDNGGMDSYNINGSRAQTNEFLLDGTPNTSSEGFGSPNNLTFAPPPDAVSESKVQTSTYDAQYGRTGGGTVNVGLKSGTNKFHANLYDYWRNTVLNANTFDGNLSGQGKVPFHWNEPGVEVEGPLYIPKLYDGRNRTFFMYNWEDIRDSVPYSQTYTVATAAERNGDFSGLLNSTGQRVTIYDPLSTVATTVNGVTTYSRTPFAGNIIPQNRINRVSRNMLAYLPLPNVPGNGFGQNNFSDPSNTRSDKYDIHSFRFDHAFNEQNKLFVDILRSNRHEVNDTAGFVGAASPLYLHWRTNTGVIADVTSILSPTTVLDSRVSFNRHAFAIARHASGFDPTQLGFSPSFASQLATPSFPYMNVGSYYSNVNFAGFGYTGSQYTYTNTISWSETLSKTLNAHSVRVGFNFRNIRNNVNSPTSSAGTFAFNNSYTQANPVQPSNTSGDAFAAFLLGAPASGSVPINTSFAYQSLYYAGFFQDDWRVNSRLTLNLGVRWDYESPISERYNRQNAGFDMSALSPLQVPGFRTVYGGLLFTGNSASNRLPFRRDLNNWQPRFGLAYKITSSTVFRGGYGITYLPTIDIGQNNGYSTTTSFVSSANNAGLVPLNYLDNPYPSGILQPVGSSLGLATQLGQSVTYSNPNRKIPYVHQFSAQIQQQVPWQILLSAGYAGSRSEALQAAKQINVVPASALSLGNGLLASVPNPFFGRLSGTLNTPNTTVQQLLLPFPQFLTVTGLNNSFGYSSYDSLQVNVDKRFSKGLYFIASYTYSKALEATTYLNNQDPFSDPARRLSNFDAPHRFTIAGGYSLPFFKDKGLANIFLGGWQVNAMAYYQSGFPMPAPTSGGGTITGTPNTTGATSFTGGAISTGINPAIDVTDRFSAQFNTCTISLAGARQNCSSASQPAAWRIQSPYELATLSPFLPGIRVPRPHQVNASLFKTFSLTEAVRLQFRAEAFNITNTPWFGTPTTAINSGSFGQVAKTQTNDARSLQLALRLSF